MLLEFLGLDRQEILVSQAKSGKMLFKLTFEKLKIIF